MSEEFYFSLEKAREELEKRKNLRGKVEDWWKEKKLDSPFLGFLQNTNDCFGFFARHVGTFRIEDGCFFHLAKKIELKPVWLEYTADKFVDISSFKRSLVKRHVALKKGKRGGYQVKVHELYNPVRCNGKPLREIHGLVDFHHNLRRNFLAPEEDLVFDLSDDLYVASCGGRPRARDYYPFLLSISIAHGILFEDFHSGESGDELVGFTRNVFEPSFAEVKEIFGLSPIIVKMPWAVHFKMYPAEELGQGWVDALQPFNGLSSS